MTNYRGLPALDKFREEFREHLLAAAEANPTPRPSLLRKLGAPLIALTLVAGATGIAVAGGVIGGGEAQKVHATDLWDSGGTYPDCPTEVRNSLVKLDELSEYADTPGYPVAGCPTLEELEAIPGVGAEISTMGEQRGAEE